MSGRAQKTSEPALRASLWLLAERGVSLVLGAATTWFLARSLGVGGYGHYSLALTVVSSFALLTDLVSGQVVVREAASRPEAESRIIGSALLLRIALSALALLACAVAASGYPTVVRSAIAIYSLTLLLAPCETFAALMQARLRLRKLTLIGMGTAGLNAVLLLAALRAGASLPIVMAAVSLPLLVRSVAIMALFRKEVGWTVRPRFSRVEGKRLLTGSWPLAASVLLSQAPQNLPAFCLASLADNGVQLGTFAAAARVPVLMMMVPSTVMVALFPLLARACATGSEQARAVLDRAYAMLLAMALPITISCVVLAPEAIHLLYGGQFADSVTGFRLLSLALLFMYPGIVAGNMLVAMGRERESLRITAGAALLAGVLIPWLSRAHGAVGAAAAVAAVQAAMGTATILAVRRRCRYRPAPSAAFHWCHRITGCALVMTGTCVLLRRIDSFAALLGGAIVYLICLWLTRLTPIVLRLPTLEALATDGEGEAVADHATPGAGGSPSRDRHPPSAGARPASRDGSAPVRPGLPTRVARRLENLLVSAFWHLCYLRSRRAARRNTPAQLPEPRVRSASGASLLVIDRDYIGDVVCATPVLSALRRQFPEATITLAVAPQVAPLFQHDPRVDAVVALELGPGLRGARRLWRQLRSLAPQSVVVGLGAVPANAWLGHLAGVAAGAPIRLGEAHGPYHDLLTHPVERSERIRHWSALYLDVLRPLEAEAAGYPPKVGGGRPTPLPGEAPGPRPSLAVSAEARAVAERFMAEEGLPARPWIGIHAGGRRYLIPDRTAPGGLASLSRRWPAERYGQLARRLIDDGATVILTGAPEDAEVNEQVRRAAGSTGRVIDATGRLRLAETAALLSLLDAFVTNDTGPMHMALALDVPTVCLFGPTDPRRVGPIGRPPHQQALAPEIACSPCAGTALVPCRNPDGQVCLEAIPVERVYAAVRQALGVERCAVGMAPLPGAQRPTPAAGVSFGTEAAVPSRGEPRVRGPEPRLPSREPEER